MAITSVKVNTFVKPFNETAQADTQLSISNYYGFQPLKTGNRAPYFHHPVTQTLFPKNNNHRSLSRLKYTKPVVLIFRPIFHNDADIQRLFLESLQADINVMGGELMTVTNASIRDLLANLQQDNRLHIFSDKENNISTQYGLYNAENPVTDWLSGIEGDISLPAFYIINPNGKIVYHYIDYNFRTYGYDNIYGQLFIRQLLTNVYQNAQKLKEKLN
ncbi:MAG: redoxin domain-containing protein [Arachidicoccus sp.]|nr:redoxin domain-containing protein [Arachidicoccus sp.]